MILQPHWKGDGKGKVRLSARHKNTQRDMLSGICSKLGAPEPYKPNLLEGVWKPVNAQRRAGSMDFASLPSLK